MTQKRLDRALKIVFVIWLILMAALVHAFRANFVTHKSAPPISEAKLNLWYQGINEEYFSSTLPKNVEVKWGDLTLLKDMGVTNRHADGSYTIVLDPKQNPNRRIAEFTEYHEICHIATPPEVDQHGPKFQACMLRLAQEGAFKDLW